MSVSSLEASPCAGKFVLQRMSGSLKSVTAGPCSVRIVPLRPSSFLLGCPNTNWQGGTVSELQRPTAAHLNAGPRPIAESLPTARSIFHLALRARRPYVLVLCEPCQAANCRPIAVYDYGRRRCQRAGRPGASTLGDLGYEEKGPY